MNPECQAMIERAIDQAAGSCRQWRAAFESRHLRSLSAALDVAHGYQPGEGGWWLDRMTRLEPLRMVLSTHAELYLVPLVLVHRQVLDTRAVMHGLWLKEINTSLPALFEEHARTRAQQARDLIAGLVEEGVSL